jgi:(p)ppGpp synthase/HD superfamily hydrolase
MRFRKADKIAAEAHDGQVDKLGVPYIEHVRAVAAGLKHFPVELQIAGVLHDVLEDTDWDWPRLREAGVPTSVLIIVEAVTKRPGSTRKEQIEKVIKEGYAACLVKISDNAHNSHPDRLKLLPDDMRKRLEGKYAEARQMLWTCGIPLNWGALYFDDIESILKIVNPSLLPELEKCRIEHS